jgi:hypothetical protein
VGVVGVVGIADEGAVIDDDVSVDGDGVRVMMLRGTDTV